MAGCDFNEGGEETADGKCPRLRGLTYIDVDRKGTQNLWVIFTGCALCLVDVVGIIDR